jgi:hypothetical protein
MGESGSYISRITNPQICYIRVHSASMAICGEIKVYICGLAYLRNLRICDCGLSPENLRICDLRTFKKHLRAYLCLLVLLSSKQAGPELLS